MKIAIYGQYYKKTYKEYIERILKILESKEAEIIIEQNFYLVIKEQLSLKKEYPTYNTQIGLDKSVDFMVTLGGDGTILRAITYLKNLNIPLIGVNAGRMGFLANIQKNELEESFNRLFEKDYTTTERPLLEIQTNENNQVILPLNFALNEITVSRKNTTSMITIEAYLNDMYLSSYWADGLIVATTTGSTSYSLSCGGPVITPDSKNLILTPIAPHNLNARPLVIPDDVKIRLKIKGYENLYLLSLDSRVITLNDYNEIYIQKAPYGIKMIEFKKDNFLLTLRKKLLWGEDTRN